MRSLPVRDSPPQPLSRPDRVAWTPVQCEDESDIEALVERARTGEEAATLELLHRFRPLLRSRMHLLWGAVHEGLSTLEWDDIESQVTLLFLHRVRGFQSERGVFFAHYIERMLTLDCRAWLRSQRRGHAIPFSQLGMPGAGDDAEGAGWLIESSADPSTDLDRVLGLREALARLSPAQRQVVWGCCVLGRTEAALAAELGLSRSTVRNRLESAVTNLRTFFEEGDSGATATGTRTGRIVQARQGPAHSAFWGVLIDMAKDEKRPDLVGVGAGRVVLLQGTFDFSATGLHQSTLLSPRLSYTVPPGSVLGVRYLRVGSVSRGMVAVSTVVNGLTHRIVPCASDASMHVSFAIVDPIPAGSQLEIHIASQHEGTAIIDCGCLLMPA